MLFYTRFLIELSVKPLHHKTLSQRNISIIQGPVKVINSGNILYQQKTSNPENTHEIRNLYFAALGWNPLSYKIILPVHLASALYWIIQIVTATAERSIYNLQDHNFKNILQTELIIVISRFSYFLVIQNGLL